MEPHRDHIALLVADLTAGPAQGRGALRTAGGDCCLGRACEVYHRATGNGRWVPPGSRRVPGHMAFTAGGQLDDAVMPAEVAGFYGLDANPSLMVRDGGSLPVAATECNDDLRMTLPEIGEAFRRTYLR